MSSNFLSRLLEGLELAGVKHGSRNKTVAEKTGYSVGTVNRILSGNAALTARFIQAVCSGFGINPYWIEKGEKPIRTTITPSEFIEELSMVLEQEKKESKTDATIPKDKTPAMGAFNTEYNKENRLGILVGLARSREFRIGKIMLMLAQLTDSEINTVYEFMRKKFEDR